MQYGLIAFELTAVETEDMTQSSIYIHGTHPEEQKRLSLLNDLTNGSFLEFIEAGPGHSVLEVGSGLGILTNCVATRFPDCYVVGLEIAPEQLEKATASFSETRNLRFLEGDALALEFPESTFDVVYCRYLLEHVSDPAVVVNELLRVLKPGGRVFLQENNILIYEIYPDCPSYSKVLEKFAELQSRSGGDAEIGKKLFSILKHAGFRSIDLSIGPEVHHYDLPTFDPWIVNCREIIKGAKKRLTALDGVSEKLVEDAISELDNLRENPYASAYFYWNRASAIKPPRVL
jgi:ubiquinone/menaquinone biosynthesis C-methylase UbiE